MFAKIMAVVLVAILITTAGMSAVWYVTLRNQQIDARLEELIAEANDIAYLAANMNGGGFGSFLGFSPSSAYSARSFLNLKAKQVNDEFGAYIAVVDRRGNVMDNTQTAYSEDPDFVESLSGEQITDALNRILKGETIRLRSSGPNGPTFTVGVPFKQNDSDTTASGAVFIQTKAQQIESGLDKLLWQIIAMAAGVILLSGVAVFLFIRSAMRPLGRLAAAAGSIAGGDFSVQLDEKRGDTEMRKVNHAFNSMTRQLRDIEEGRREFVSNVSHELRTPITSIRGFAEGLADGVIPEEERESTLRLVADESKRLSSLVNDLLELSRMDKDKVVLNRTVFDINEMLRRAVIRRMNDIDRKKIDVSCEFGEDPCMVRADSDRIEEVVINLLDNALKFTPEGGAIVMESAVADGLALVTVRDNGPGVPEEDRERVFERFFTADRAHTTGKGTGLGLSISQKIIELHGQSIRLLDTREGAAFRFTLEHVKQERLTAASAGNLTEG
jgi:signal transduction histidine kinase